MKAEISRFLKRFHDYDTVDEIFTNGCCFWFAVTMVLRFQGKLMYDPIYGHFVTKIDDHLYDITGDVTEKYNPIPWEDIHDETYKQRIVRDCIMF